MRLTTTAKYTIMNKFAYLAFATVPAMVAPASAQEQTFTVKDYIDTQMAILDGVTKLLNLDSIAEAPGDVAAAINQMNQYAAALISLKDQLNADELAAAQGNLEGDPIAQMIGSSFMKAVNDAADKNFYNSNELAQAVQQLAALLANL